MPNESSVVLWPGLPAEARPWVARSDAGWDGLSASLGVALFSPDGEWAASVSRPISAEWREAIGTGKSELLALHEAAMLARQVCPGQPLLMLSDSDEALTLVGRGGRSSTGPVRKLALDILLELSGRPQSSCMWMPREGNRLADALATRARAIPRANGFAATRPADFASLAKLDHQWLLAQPARDSRDFVRQGVAVVLNKAAPPTSRRKMSLASFAQLAWHKLGPAERDTLALLHAMPESERVQRALRRAPERADGRDYSAKAGRSFSLDAFRRAVERLPVGPARDTSGRSMNGVFRVNVARWQAKSGANAGGDNPAGVWGLGQASHAGEGATLRFARFGRWGAGEISFERAVVIAAVQWARERAASTLILANAPIDACSPQWRAAQRWAADQDMSVLLEAQMEEKPLAVQKELFRNVLWVAAEARRAQVAGPDWAARQSFFVERARDNLERIARNHQSRKNQDSRAKSSATNSAPHSTQAASAPANPTPLHPAPSRALARPANARRDAVFDAGRSPNGVLAPQFGRRRRSGG